MSERLGTKAVPESGDRLFLQKLAAARITNENQHHLAGASHGLWPQLLQQFSPLNVDKDGRLNFNLVPCPLAVRIPFACLRGQPPPLQPKLWLRNPVVVAQTAGGSGRCGGSWSQIASVNSGFLGAVLPVFHRIKQPNEYVVDKLVVSHVQKTRQLLLKVVPESGHRLSLHKLQCAQVGD